MGGDGPDDHYQRRYPDLLYASGDKSCLRDSKIGLKKFYFFSFSTLMPHVSPGLGAIVGEIRIGGIPAGLNKPAVGVSGFVLLPDRLSQLTCFRLPVRPRHYLLGQNVNYRSW